MNFLARCNPFFHVVGRLSYDMSYDATRRPERAAIFDTRAFPEKYSINWYGFPAKSGRCLPTCGPEKTP